MNEDAILAVKKGIYWLDENHPGWASRIVLSSLDMSGCRECVIGQAVGDYVETIKAEGKDSDDIYSSGVIWAVEHGFEKPGIITYQGIAGVSGNYGYSELDALWATEVEERNGCNR